MSARCNLSLTRGQALAVMLDAEQHALDAERPQDRTTWRAIEREARRALAHDDAKTGTDGLRKDERAARRRKEEARQLGLFDEERHS